MNNSHHWNIAIFQKTNFLANHMNYKNSITTNWILGLKKNPPNWQAIRGQDTNLIRKTVSCLSRTLSQQIKYPPWMEWNCCRYTLEGNSTLNFSSGFIRRIQNRRDVASLLKKLAASMQSKLIITLPVKIPIRLRKRFTLCWSLRHFSLQWWIWFVGIKTVGAILLLK